MSVPKLETVHLCPFEAALYAERQRWYREAGLTVEDFAALVQRRRIALNATPATAREAR